MIFLHSSTLGHKVLWVRSVQWYHSIALLSSQYTLQLLLVQCCWTRYLLLENSFNKMLLKGKLILVNTVCLNIPCVYGKKIQTLSHVCIII